MSEAQQDDHGCVFVERPVWDEWEPRGTLRERFLRRIPACKICGRERASRSVRVPVAVETEAGSPGSPPLPSTEGRTVAAEIARRVSRSGKPDLPSRGIIEALGRKGLRASVVENRLEAFMQAGWLGLQWDRRGTRRSLKRLRVKDPCAIEDFGRPGERDRRSEAIRGANAAVAGLRHPVAEEITRLVSGERAERMPPALIEALSAVAKHIASGDVLAERVFSVRYLGDSKALLKVRRSLERLLGPLEQLGIRTGGAVTLVGGSGILRVPGQCLDLARLRPCLGLSRDTMMSVDAVEFPERGLLVVENLTAFEACCLGEVAGARDCLIAWSGGYPGRGVRSLVAHAAASGSPVRVWADLDLDGVRIVRLVTSWAPECVSPWRMSKDVLAAAPASLPLGRRAAAAIKRDLEANPDAPLAGALEAMLSRGQWVEQEGLLGPSGVRPAVNTVQQVRKKERE